MIRRNLPDNIKRLADEAPDCPACGVRPAVDMEIDTWSYGNKVIYALRCPRCHLRSPEVEARTRNMEMVSGWRERLFETWSSMEVEP